MKNFHTPVSLPVKYLILVQHRKEACLGSQVRLSLNQLYSVFLMSMHTILAPEEGEYGANIGLAEAAHEIRPNSSLPRFSSYTGKSR